VALAQAIGSAYGNGAGDAFLALWRKHIGFIVDYTTGVASKDQKKADKAVADLLGSTKDFGAFLLTCYCSLPPSVGARPAALSPCRNTNSIWPLSDRSSSDAQRCRAS
jgi:hypothetical protein